ncbi:hypothetical protein FACS189413_12740 [Bacteroidia bacterium]|nr:hypothetical protein FACS189413_12740 [Bacteroidia bacterium]
MFERNLAIQIFMGVSFGFLALEFLFFGLFLDQMLLEIGTYSYAIDVFNSIVLYVFLVDFIVKFFFKPNQSMQIAPYLAMPIPRNRLFDFLLIKEFYSFWNLFWLFLVLPFALKSITPFFGFGTAVIYILFFYLVCVAIGMAVNLINHWIQKSFWFYIIPVVLVAIPLLAQILLNLPVGDYTQKTGDLILNFNPFIWLILLALLTGLWYLNQQQMRETVYHELEGEKNEKISSFSSLSFLDRFGSIGTFINLEIKMIMRSPRLKQQVLVAGGLCLVFFTWMVYDPNNMFGQQGEFVFFLYGILTYGLIGLIMGQYIFTAESSFFDGLIARKLSIYELLKSKYSFYSAYSLFVTILLMIPAAQGKISFLLVFALFFYTIGPIYCLIFQNAVYNKTFFDLFDKGMMNWKGQSGNMIAITMITMFLPVVIVLILYSLIGETSTCWIMLILGIAFTATSRLWLKNIYKRFSKRKYKNMEGFRSNA